MPNLIFINKIIIMKNILFLASFLIFASTGWSQEMSLKIEEEVINLKVEETKRIKATVINADGKKAEGRKAYYYSGNRRSIGTDSLGNVTAYDPGEFKVIVVSPDPDGKEYLRKDILVNVKYPPIKEIKLEFVPVQIYEGTTIPINTVVIDERGTIRPDVKLQGKSSNPEVISFDPYLNITGHKPGKAELTLKSKNGIEAKVDVKVIDNPVAKVDLSSDMEEARTGDVFHFSAKAVDKSGKEVKDAPVYYSYNGKADDVSSSASGLIKQDGRFVANEAGIYTITASSGPMSAKKTVKIVPRNVSRKIELVGKGLVNDKHTSDFWIWEGVDGKDYAVTGTWGADGTAYFWDVTDPSNITKIDSVQVDARTVNDVKVSEDGKIAIISREGASNRKNGIIIIDVTDPSDVEILSTFTENLTGGVHNLFISKGHVYALSDGRKYYSINIEDPKNPYIVGKFELDTRGHSIHDVWVQDGIAYSSNWSDGIRLVDVGNGIAGGSPENPKEFASYTYPSGANHASFPFKSKSTGKFYVIGGDEIFPYGLSTTKENIAAGFLHFVDFSVLEAPDEIAYFKLPQAGSHNYWVDEENELLYAAFYNGGLRVIDISGDLMGDLYKQGREIAWIIPSDPEGYIPNAPFTWGAQPHKGHIFYSDWNSGLWAAKLAPEKPEETKIESR